MTRRIPDRRGELCWPRSKSPPAVISTASICHPVSTSRSFRNGIMQSTGLPGTTVCLGMRLQPIRSDISRGEKKLCDYCWARATSRVVQNLCFVTEYGREPRRHIRCLRRIRRRRLTAKVPHRFVRYSNTRCQWLNKLVAILFQWSVFEGVIARTVRLVARPSSGPHD